MFVESAIRGNNVLGTASLVYAAQQLIEDPNLSSLTDNMDWYFLFVANPDGYQWAMEVDQGWTRTRSFNADQREDDCRGAEAERNWAVGWRNEDNADQCSAEWYGDFAFSEVEINHVADFFKKMTIDDIYDGNLVFYAGVQSGIGALVHPWGYDTVRPAPYNDPGRLARQALALAVDDDGVTLTDKYAVGTPAEIYGRDQVTGLSIDWLTLYGDVDYAFIMEFDTAGVEDYDIRRGDIAAQICDRGRDLLLFHAEAAKLIYAENGDANGAKLIDFSAVLAVVTFLLNRLF